MDTGRTVLAVLAGVGAGVALGFWFASEKNAKLRKKISKSLDSAGDDIKAKVFEEFKELKSKAFEMKDSGASMKDKILYAVKDMKEESKQKVLDFIEKAKAESIKLQSDAKKVFSQT